MKIKVHTVKYQRNGSAGVGFFHVRFDTGRGKGAEAVQLTWLAQEQIDAMHRVDAQIENGAAGLIGVE